MVNSVLEYLPLRSLGYLATLPYMDHIVRDHLRRRIESTIAASGLHVQNTLSMMEQSGTVISGSAALEIAAPGLCSPNDLNLYCPLESYSDAIDLITQTDGYIAEQERTTTVAARRTPFSKLNVNNGVRRMWKFRHISTGRRITLTESLSPSPLAPIFFFHLTSLMNCVTGRGAVSFYPEMSEKYTVQALINRSKNFETIHRPLEVSKWTDRGTTIIPDCADTHPGHPSSVTRERRGMCQWSYRHTKDPWTTYLAFKKPELECDIGPALAWRLGHLFKARGQIKIYAPTVHLLHEEWHLRTFRLLEIWIEYAAPLDGDTSVIAPEAWRRSFP
ncbi:hypothetical protein DFP72DRAFT_857664 [Ephemerocybe angulata]|uniref:Uncharacterized protein n=1 Tax=Ephemerocybe angulata TaxID=980116 RepID=A0A8H6LUI4_9AGAR|nr:hypothetical protein DFP72DRAFT_857664 [Tulosesus angulatus]